MKHKTLKQMLATVALLLCSIVAMAETVIVNGIAYEVDATEKTATVIAKESGKYSGNIVIPETVEHNGEIYSVTTIGEYAFDNCPYLTSVTIGNSVTTIGEFAFYECFDLTSVTIPNSVTTIGIGAFEFCTGLTNAIIGNGVTTIGTGTFANCTALETVVIGEGVKTIDRAFGNCENLTNVYCLATSVPSTGSKAFNNTNVASATLHVPEESIDSYKSTAPWSGFGTIKAITNEVELTYEFNIIEKTATVIASESGYTGDIVIPETVKYNGVVYNVTAIGYGAFAGCRGLISVTIPNSVTTIGEFAFSNCTDLTSINLGNGVTTIGEAAFWNCDGLTNVVIGDDVTEIGNNAFQSCDVLTSITIPNSVTVIGADVFSDCI